MLGVGSRKLPAATAGQQRWVLAENGPLELAQLGARIDAQLLGERLARPLERGECICLPAGAIEREHELRPQTLPVRMLGDQLLELRNETVVIAERKLRVDPELVRRVPAFAEDCTLGFERLEREVGQRLPPPERERLGQPLGSQLRRSLLEPGATVGHEPVEAVDVELPRADRQQIAGAPRLDAIATELLPQPVDVDLQRAVSARRRFVPPDEVDRALGRYDLVRMQDQEREQRALLRSAQLHETTIDLGLEGSEQPERCHLRELSTGSRTGKEPRPDGRASARGRRCGRASGRTGRARS